MSHTYEWVMSHIQMSHVSHTNESRCTYKALPRRHSQSTHNNRCAPSRCYVSRTNESCPTYTWVIFHIQISPVSHTKWVSHIQSVIMWVSHIQRVTKYYVSVSHIWTVSASEVRLCNTLYVRHSHNNTCYKVLPLRHSRSIKNNRCERSREFCVPNNALSNGSTFA